MRSMQARLCANARQYSIMLGCLDLSSHASNLLACTHLHSHLEILGVTVGLTLFRLPQATMFITRSLTAPLPRSRGLLTADS